MEKIEIKRINEELYINLNDLIEFQNLYDSLEERLNIIKEQTTQTIKINLILGYRKISSQELYCLIDLILKDEKMLINSIDNNYVESNNIEIYEGTIRGGETKIFGGKVLVLGDINPNSLVIVKDEIYVIGKVKGKVIVRNKKGKIDASSYINSYIKIFDKSCSLFNYNNVLTIDYETINNSKGERIYV